MELGCILDEPDRQRQTPIWIAWTTPPCAKLSARTPSRRSVNDVLLSEVARAGSIAYIQIFFQPNLCTKVNTGYGITMNFLEYEINILNDFGSDISTIIAQELCIRLVNVSMQHIFMAIGEEEKMSVSNSNQNVVLHSSSRFKSPPQRSAVARNRRNSSSRESL